MDTFVRSTASTLALSEPTCRRIATGLMALIEARAERGDHQVVAKAFHVPIPAAEPRSDSARPAGSGMGSMLQRASTVLGAGAGPTSSRVARIFEEAGLSPEASARFLAAFAAAIERQAGRDVAERVAACIPELRAAPPR